jgi:hypothetical protein
MQYRWEAMLIRSELFGRAGIKPASPMPIPRGIGTGSLAEAFYGEVPPAIVEEVRRRIPAKLWRVIEQFSSKYAAQAGGQHRDS